MQEVVFVFLPSRPPHIVVKLLDFDIKLLLFLIYPDTILSPQPTRGERQLHQTSTIWYQTLQLWKHRSGVDILPSHGANLLVQGLVMVVNASTEAFQSEHGSKTRLN